MSELVRRAEEKMSSSQELALTEAVANNSEMTGMDGYQDGSQVSFPYKSVDAVKSYFKCKHANCR